MRSPSDFVDPDADFLAAKSVITRAVCKWDLCISVERVNPVDSAPRRGQIASPCRVADGCDNLTGAVISIFSDATLDADNKSNQSGTILRVNKSGGLRQRRFFAVRATTAVRQAPSLHRRCQSAVGSLRCSCGYAGCPQSRSPSTGRLWRHIRRRSHTPTLRSSP